MSYTLRDYLCPVCGPFEELVERVDGRPPAEIPCATCSAPAELAVSAPALHLRYTFTTTRGKAEPKPHRMATDTRAMGEGQDRDDWKADRAKMWAEHRRQQLKAVRE